MNKTNLIIGGILALILLVAGFTGGWYAHKELRPCQIITTDIITVQDPYWHHIADSLAGLPPKEVWKWHPKDTLFVPGDTVIQQVDTAAILKDYFSVYKYQWFKNDDTLSVELNTTVTENKPIAYDLKYKVIPSFTTTINNVDNSTNYTKYFYLGLNVPIKDVKYLDLEALYAFPKGYLGIGYGPELNSVTAKAGVTIFKIKDKR